MGRSGASPRGYRWDEREHVASARARTPWRMSSLSLSVCLRGREGGRGRGRERRGRRQRRDDVRVRDYGDQCGKPCLFCAGPTHTRANIHRHVVPKSAICRFHSSPLYGLTLRLLRSRAASPFFYPRICGKDRPVRDTTLRLLIPFSILKFSYRVSKIDKTVYIVRFDRFRGALLLGIIDSNDQVNDCYTCFLRFNAVASIL